MPTLTAQEESTKRAEDAVLKKLRKGARTQKQLGATRHRLLALREKKLIKRAGEAKNPGRPGRPSPTS